MAVTPIIGTAGIRQLQRDLAAMAPDSLVEMREVIKGAMGPMLGAAKAKAYSHRQTGELGDRWSSSVRGTVGRLKNTLPQARPLEFGGTIAPKGGPIKLPTVGMVYGPGGAIDKGKSSTERNLLAGFERLARRHGFTGP